MEKSIVTKRNSVLALAFVTALAAATSSLGAFANDPIPGVDIMIKRNPGGIAVQAKTDSAGHFTLSGLTPGKYTLQLASKSLDMAIRKLDPKGASHMVSIKIGLSATDPKPLLSAEPMVRPGATQDLSVNFTIPESKPAGSATAKLPDYVGTLALGGMEQRQLQTTVITDAAVPGISDQGAAGGLSSYMRVTRDAWDKIQRNRMDAENMLMLVRVGDVESVKQLLMKNGSAKELEIMLSPDSKQAKQLKATMVMAGSKVRVSIAGA